ncbi:DUF6461 domain-containing protein [Microbispora sp. H10830]|uniref:DUF6461 domain-containing protein n=1 Tax=Microbispora sp. H10830 TaxID=2729109 RepID=UPI0015FFD2D6|nr:DUF6461 domain-containing protein [Microbispora sp. H10830]
MSDEDLSHYSALVSNWMSDPACVTWCQGMDVPEVARSFGADPASGIPMTFMDTEMEHYDEALQTVLIGSLGDWSLAIEPNGGEGRSPGTIAALSKGGEALSLYWDGPVKVELNYAAHGRLIATIPKSPVAEWPAAARDRLLPYAWDLPFTMLPDEQWKVAAFTLASRLSHVRLTDQWLDREHTRFVLSSVV